MKLEKTRNLKMANTKILLWDLNCYQNHFHLRFLEEEDFQTAVDKFQGGFLEFDMIMKLDNSKTFVYF